MWQAPPAMEIPGGGVGGGGLSESAFCISRVGYS